MKRSTMLLVARVIPLMALALMATFPGAAALAHPDDAYSNESDTGETKTDWMSKVKGRTPLSQLSIPGTHDSGAFVFGRETTETQGMTIGAQLEAGIRFFDIRLGWNAALICPDPDLWVFHGIACQFKKFKADVLDKMRDFLAAHPREAILMRVKQDAGNNDGLFAERVIADLSGYKKILYRGDSHNPKLREIRGKIVIVGSFTVPDAEDVVALKALTTMIQWGEVDLQDEFSMGDNWDLAIKWRQHVVPQLNDANHMVDDPDKIHINFLSAAGGGFPYFFASGHSSWETGASRLATGWTEGEIDTCGAASRCISEYPCLDEFLGTCTVYFEGINTLTKNYLNSGTWTRAGIVVADFPGRGLIQAIINVNPPCKSCCSSIPETTCTASTKGTLLVDERSPGNEQVLARIVKDGFGLNQADLGNPVNDGGTDYSLCIYGGGQLVGELDVDQAGAECDSRPCWKAVGGLPPGGTAYGYLDKLREADGVDRIYLSADSGQTPAQIRVSAANSTSRARVALPTGIAAALAGKTEAIVQLKTSESTCFSATIPRKDRAHLATYFRGRAE